MSLLVAGNVPTFGARVVNACRALSLRLRQRRTKVLNARKASFH